MKALDIARKDLKIEFREKSTLNFMILFSLIATMMFNVTIPQKFSRDLFAPLLWLVFLFVGMLGYSRAFLREIELETIDGLRLAPISPLSILFGKIIFNLVIMLLIELIILPIFLIFFELKMQIANPAMFLISLTAGNISFVIVSSSLSYLIIKSKARELLLPIILFPVIFPIITSTINAMQMAMNGFAGISSPLSLIISFTVAIIGVAYLTFEYVFLE